MRQEELSMLIAFVFYAIISFLFICCIWTGDVIVYENSLVFKIIATTIFAFVAGAFIFLAIVIIKKWKKGE